MNFIKYITALLLSLDPSYSDNESWIERTARMEMIATAIDDASSKATCSNEYTNSECKKIWNQNKRSIALLLVTQGFWESRFAKNVHEGKCKKYECDSYSVNGNIFHRARSPWQVQRTGMVTKEEYEKMNAATLESTTMSANVASRYLAIGMKACNTILGTIAIYGGAGFCSWQGAAPREAFYRKINSISDDQIFAAADAKSLKFNKKNADVVFVNDVATKKK